MKIALVVPANSAEGEKRFYDYRFYSTFLLSKKYISYPLSIPTLAALTPPGHEVRVFDENVEAIDYSWDADLVGITVRTMFAKRAYDISQAYGRTGAKIVLGGSIPPCPLQRPRNTATASWWARRSTFGTLSWRISSRAT